MTERKAFRINHGNNRHLYRIREARRELKTAIDAVGSLGLEINTDPMYDIYDSLTGSIVVIDVPCIICKKPQPWEFKVHDEGYPATVLCKECDDRITAIVMEERAKQR